MKKLILLFTLSILIFTSSPYSDSRRDKGELIFPQHAFCYDRNRDSPLIRLRFLLIMENTSMHSGEIRVGIEN